MYICISIISFFCYVVHFFFLFGPGYTKGRIDIAKPFYVQIEIENSLLKFGNKIFHLIDIN